MSDKKNDTRSQITGNESKKQTTVGFIKNQPSKVDPSKKERVPNEKVPNIGDPKRKLSTEDVSDKKTTSIITTEKQNTPSATNHQEQSKHDQVTNADVKITNQHESDQKFNGSRF